MIERLKRDFSPWGDEFLQFQKFLKKNRWSLFFSSFLILAVFGSWLFDADLYIDSEFLINEPYSSYNWLSIGRQGDVLTKYLFGLGWFHPLFARVSAFLLLCVTGALIGYLFYRMNGEDHLLFSFTGALYFTFPVFAEQFYFSLQIFEISWALLACVAGVGLCWFGLLQKNRPALLLAPLLMIWSFSSYQIFMILHVALVVICFLFLYRRWSLTENRSVTARSYLTLIAQNIILFGIAAAANGLITKLFFSDSAYLSSQRAWNGVQSVRLILQIISNGFWGRSTFYTPAFGALAALVVALLLFRLLLSPKKPLKWLYLLAGVFFQITPFLLTIYMAKVMPVRTQLVYPLVLAGNLLFLASEKPKRGDRCLRALCLAGACLLLWMQSSVTMRLLYTDHIRKTVDLRIASQIEERVRQVAENPKKLAFVGSYSPDLNAACLYGEFIGTSIFESDFIIEPHYFYSTYRACNLLNTMGFSCSPVSAGQMAQARNYARDLPCWPAQGSVADCGDFVIVKLSEDDWPEETNGGVSDRLFLSEVGFPEQIPSDPSLQYRIEDVRTAGDCLLIDGWLLREGSHSGTAICTAYLRNRNSRDSYEVYLRKTMSPNVKRLFRPGMLYGNAGFRIYVPVRELPEDISAYELILGYCRENSDRSFVVTDFGSDNSR